ncbi:type I-F CRISPR-associated helicase Cas3f [Pseudomonas sp. NY15437]|uniref:type I-F CRISPR-associated helicase Cas3f n=1 Tax=Pseudomonas sp. NY15437 TaxID=3400360 RepID=UPI003A898DCE
MNVLLISQCDKRALKESRRLLDQFAERRGERTWQTPITQAGLDTLRRLLRRSARKNTAVACHWIRGKDHSELLWIVGDASRFNAQGAVPTNSSERAILRADDENDWHNAEAIRLLAQMAALLHDLGKACAAFQQRLRKPVREANLVRHEWISLRLFQAFVGADDDEGWLQRLAAPRDKDDACWLAPSRLLRDGLDGAAAHGAPPFARLPPLAAAIGWLMVSHHRLPTLPVYDDRTGQQHALGKRHPSFSAEQLDGLLATVGPDWNERRQPAAADLLPAYWHFPQGLPVTQPCWRAQASKLAARLQQLNAKHGQGNWLDNPYVMHLARLSLMLADHHYSALPHGAPQRVKGDTARSDTRALFANTGQDAEGHTRLKQPLDEHLLGVARDCATIVHGLPGFARYLPRLAQHRGLRKRSGSPRFAWQDKATDTAASMRERAAEHGAFIVNMASTGCGKTLANARIMNALADPQQGLRCTFALGLRTLTLQTGRAYRKELRLNDDELAVLVGGTANRTLFEFYQQQAEAEGSASIQALLDEDSHVFYEGHTADHPLLAKALADASIRKLLSAPLLVCTIDHLMPATEAQRAGRQIAPMLRLMSADLVLDELDDFDLADLPALTRLVHWAGLLGSRVLICSATLPPALVEGMYQAYRAGRRHYQNNRGAHSGRAAEVACLWVDEFGVQEQACAQVETFVSAHARFTEKRVKALRQAIADDGPRRCGLLIPLNIPAQQTEAIRHAFAEQVLRAASWAHTAHGQICPHSGKRASFGLVRMANIEPLFEVALALLRLGAPPGMRIHLCVYHARFPLLLRSAIEQRLDRALDRRNPDAVWSLPDIRTALDGHAETEHLFLVLASPVSEVGRDHDYDWALVEPSSMRSLIQLAGRVQRHRNQPCQSPNIFIFDTNLRHFEAERGHDDQPRAIYLRPGFEADAPLASAPFRLTRHRLGKLLREDEYRHITACPRIQPRPCNDWRPKESLVDLEHARLLDAMQPNAGELNAASAWQSPRAALTWALPQQQRFRDDSQYRQTTLALLPDEDGDSLHLHYVKASKQQREDEYIRDDSLLQRIDLERQLGPRIGRWGQDDLLELLRVQADEQGLSLKDSAKRFATVSAPDSRQGWRYHEALGFARSR